MVRSGGRSSPDADFVLSERLLDSEWPNGQIEGVTAAVTNRAKTPLKGKPLLLLPHSHLSLACHPLPGPA